MDAAYNRLDPSLNALYAELVERLLGAEVGSTGDPPRGVFVRKRVKGREYWYLQMAGLGERHQRYVGPDSESLRAELAAIERRWDQRTATSASTAVLVSMLQAGGAHVPDATTGRLLEVLASHHVFAAGGVLIGSNAFAALGPMLGVRWRGAYQTLDVDLASDPVLAVAVALRADVPAALADSRFAFDAIPGLDPRTPSTAFAVRGTSLRLDLVTPQVGRRTGMVMLPQLGVAARPLRFLDYLLEEVQPAALVFRHGVRVNVPTPARFALHELLVAQERGPHEAVKARKDLLQASALVRLLDEDRPGDLARAWAALTERGPGWRKRAAASTRGLDDAARRIIDAL